MGERSIGIERPAKRVVRAQPDGNLKLLDRLVEPAFVGVGIPEAAIGHGKTGIELQRILERVDRQVVFAPREVYAANRVK